MKPGYTRQSVAAMGMSKARVSHELIPSGSETEPPLKSDQTQKIPEDKGFPRQFVTCLFRGSWLGRVRLLS
jgi:hypothetical protein